MILVWEKCHDVSLQIKRGAPKPNAMPLSRFHKMNRTSLISQSAQAAGWASQVTIAKHEHRRVPIKTMTPFDGVQCISGRLATVHGHVGHVGGDEQIVARMGYLLMFELIARP